MLGGVPLKFVVSMAAALVGCARGPKPVAVPPYDPEEIGSQAIEQFDRDGDGLVSVEELQEAKSLESVMSRLDANGDKKLAAEEITKRIQGYIDYRTGLAPVECTLMRGSRPVAGAKVTYEPEAFMGGSVVQASGTTSAEGNAVVSVPEEHLPSPKHAGMQPGFYRVRVTLADGTEVTNFNAGAECAGDMLNTHRFTLP
jgi:hypothetical protein